MSLRESFIAFDDRLAALGVLPLTKWWREGIGEWLDRYEREGVLDLWVCVGRGAAKSTALYKLALFFALYVDYEIPIGERHYAIVLSRLKEEAAKAQPIISHWLTLLEVRHRIAGDAIELADLPRGIRVVAASVAATSGWRAFFVAKDERSKWPSGGADDLDGAEIDTSAAAMTATHPSAPTVAAGSAWGTNRFYDAIMSGSDATKHVLGPTPTWIAAPHISEADTHRKERDPRRHAREYQCIFHVGAGAYDADDVNAIDTQLRTTNIGLAFAALAAPVLVFDSSAGLGDAWCWARAQYCVPIVDDDRWWWVEIGPDGAPEVPEGYHLGTVMVPSASGGWKRPVLDASGNHAENPLLDVEPRLVISEMRALTGKFAKRYSAEDVVDAMARDAQRWGARLCFGDPYQGYFMTSELSKRGLAFHPLKWTNESKARAVTTSRRWLRDRRLVVQPGEECEAVKKELLGFKEEIAPSGVLTYGARRGGHDDRVALLLNLAMAANERLLPGSPEAIRGRRWEIYGDGSEGWQGEVEPYANDEDDEAA